MKSSKPAFAIKTQGTPLVSDFIESVLDIDAFNAETHAEQEDAFQIIAVRSQILSALRDLESLE